MKALIIRGKDTHTVRLLDGLQACGIQCLVDENTITIDENFYDIVFIDPSLNRPIPKFHYNHLFFFDTEDDPRHFDKGPVYDLYKDKVKAYVKMSFVENDRNDSIKNIGFPLGIYPMLSNVAQFEVPEQYNNFTPVMIASPTFIGRYTPVENGIYNISIEEDIISVATHEDGHKMYNQRYDWLVSLRKNEISCEGGIVFHQGNNLSYEWQSKYFGKGINKLATNPVSYKDSINKLFNNRIGLCPAGHERICWRTYDLMATGNIIIGTDRKKQLALINPKEYITIEDGQDIGTVLHSLKRNYKEILKAHQVNKEPFKNLTPDKIIKLFLKQLE